MVDRATTDIVRVASADGLAVTAISDIVKAGDCRVTVFRDGERFQRSITAFVAPDTEEAFLRRVGERLVEELDDLGIALHRRGLLWQRGGRPMTWKLQGSSESDSQVGQAAQSLRA